MTFDWQTILTVLLAAAAAVYLGRRAWLVFSGKGGGCCANCCRSGPGTQKKKHVTILDSPSETREG